MTACILRRQWSSLIDCTHNVTFGCATAAADSASHAYLWVSHGCRGAFECGGGTVVGCGASMAAGRAERRLARRGARAH